MLQDWGWFRDDVLGPLLRGDDDDAARASPRTGPDEGELLSFQYYPSISITYLRSLS
jgi:hypothetical protein